MKKVSRFEYAIMKYINDQQLTSGEPTLPEMQYTEPKTETEELQDRIDNLTNQASRLKIIRDK